MIRHRLIRLIESRSDELANELLLRAKSSPHLASFTKVPPSELKQRVYEIYRNLGEWLVKRTEADIEKQYCTIGARRFRQGVPLSELIWAIILTKDNLWDFLNRESFPGFEMEVLAEHEMFRLIDRFFNHAMYYAARGHEKAAAADQPVEAKAILQHASR
jgi:hypothetical protein